MAHTCPSCGAPLPEAAAFCPHCARPLAPKRRARTPFPRRKALLWAGLLLALAAAGLGLRYLTRPQVYDGVGEVRYTSGGREYQLLVAWPGNRCQPAPDIYMYGDAESTIRWPSRLYVNYQDTGADAWTEFEQSVRQVTVEVVQDPAGASQLSASVPSHDDYSPDAAMVSYLDFAGDCGSPQVVWTAEMDNGDLIRVRQNIIVTRTYSYTYHYRDYPMDTLEDLQALVDRIHRETNRRDEVVICLPPVTYTGSLELSGRSFTFRGCTDGSGRTVFTDTVQVTTPDAHRINYFHDIDFLGDGGGIAISASFKCQAENCTFTGWKTGMLGYGTAWVNVIGCRFADNDVGFHFNSTGQSASHTLYHDNIFLNNGTGVLLENVPTDITLDFTGSEFAENGTDIENLCDQPIDVSQAIFSS